MRAKVSIVVLALICLGVVLVLWPGGSRQTLSDGTQLVLSGVKIGPSNTYSHGTVLSKTLGPLIPSNGLSIAGAKLQRPVTVCFRAPEDREILTAQLKISSGSPRAQSLISPRFDRQQRLLISGDDGFTYVRDIPPFQAYPDGFFGHIRAASFPRDSRFLRIRLEERDQPQGREWRGVATWVVRNPKPARVANWMPQQPAPFRLTEDIEVELGEITIRADPIHPDDIWEHVTRLPLRISRQGQLLTNWGIHDVQITDATGNFDWLGSSKTVTNDWLVYHGARALNPKVPWRLRMNFALDSDFPATNLYTFAVRWPSAANLQTNFGGWPVRLGFVNSDMLDVELLRKPPEVRLTLVGVQDEAGNNLDARAGSWGQHSFWRALSVPRTASPAPVQVHATIAIHPNFTNEFIVRPRLISSGP